MGGVGLGGVSYARFTNIESHSVSLYSNVGVVFNGGRDNGDALIGLVSHALFRSVGFEGKDSFRGACLPINNSSSSNRVMVRARGNRCALSGV